MDNITRRDLGMAYITDDAVFNQMIGTRRLIHEYNSMNPCDTNKMDQVIRQIIGQMGKNCLINQPFHCDYGSHITVGDNFFANYNCVILDVAKVEIGSNVFFAPNVAVYTAGHPIHHEARNSLYEYGIPVKIGNNVWVGGNSVILPGVTVGDNTVIGAGSVVTKDLPANVIAAGNPCRIIREITEEDKKYYYKDREFDKEAWDYISKYSDNI